MPSTRVQDKISNIQLSPPHFFNDSQCSLFPEVHYPLILFVPHFRFDCRRIVESSLIVFRMPQARHSSKNVIVDSLIGGEGRSKEGGVLCNDVNGLCLISEGAMRGENNSGVYTNLVKLASQLSPQTLANHNPPLITLESQASAVLIKEYDGRTVAIQVPSGQDTSHTNLNDSLEE
jgi:hypothetical protein